MKRNNKWRWSLVAFLLIWALYSVYPPTSSDLIDTFADQAIAPDATLNGIAAKAKQLRTTKPAQTEYKDLQEVIGTNNITQYFPGFALPTDPKPTVAILNRVQEKAAGKIKLGLDLQGGVEFLVSLSTNKNESADRVNRSQMLAQAVEVLRKRVDKFGVAEPVLQPVGDDRIDIQMPGLSEAEYESARTQIEKAAYLEFRMVHPQSRELIKEGQTIEPGYEFLAEKPRQGKSGYAYFVEKRASMTGKYIKKAYAYRDPVSNVPQIHFDLDGEGKDIFAKLTRENVGREMAIVLDGELYSAPVIQNPILDGSGMITMGNGADIREALELANILENPLETPVHIEDVRRVDPSLGKDSIQSGLRAAIIGTLAVAAFMAIYYLRAGVIANIAMFLNLVILLGVMCSIGTTLTLPGIAGIVLTVGMAVDANVLIYERLREELAHGKSIRGALAAAYARAFSTIFDSHVTTLISAVILIYLGTGPIKGFGVTLTIGVSLSLFTALVVTRLIFDFLLVRNWLNKISMFHLIRKPNWNFMKLAVPAFILSWTLIAVGIGYGFYRGNNVMGVDFAGGDRLTLRFKQKLEVGQIRQVLEKLGHGDAQVQYQSSFSDSSPESLEVVTAFNTGPESFKALAKAFPDAGLSVAAQDQVGATVGIEIQKNAIEASLLSLFGILLFVAFRYEFSFSVGAVVAVIHDVLMTLGWFFLSGRQLSAPMVAAVLTIIGFSINDTIVIFDRIREDLKMGVRGSFKELMNQALNQTLSRTIITSGTVFLSTLSLYLFGGGVINDFAFTFLVGIITGTYSSIYIASALVLWWHKGERPKSTTLVSSAPAVREARVTA